MKNFARQDTGTAITLMTPEPTGGFYKERGVEAFVRKFGYPDKNNRPDRLNFGGIHRAGERQVSTGLTMRLAGYDPGIKLEHASADAEAKRRSQFRIASKQIASLY